MTKLFLLIPDFKDTNINGSKSYYCPQCATIEGVLKYYPALSELIELNYVDFIRPRKKLVDLLGVENQSCPVLIIENEDDKNIDTSYFSAYENKKFVNTVETILKYLHEKYRIAQAHP